MNPNIFQLFHFARGNSETSSQVLNYDDEDEDEGEKRKEHRVRFSLKVVL